MKTMFLVLGALALLTSARASHKKSKIKIFYFKAGEDVPHWIENIESRINEDVSNLFLQWLIDVKVEERSDSIHIFPLEPFVDNGLVMELAPGNHNLIITRNKKDVFLHRTDWHEDKRKDMVIFLLDKTFSLSRGSLFESAAWMLIHIHY
ncbi:MAG: hypothetical protein ACE5GN_03020 [Waddliaceae bacterium]